MMQHYSHVKEGKEISAASNSADSDKPDKAVDLEEAPNCILRGCKGKCVLLTNYCFARMCGYGRLHFLITFADILQDHTQRLFKGCTYISPEGNKCNYPILVTQKPPICNGHIDLVGGAKRYAYAHHVCIVRLKINLCRERRKRKANAIEKQKKEKEQQQIMKKEQQEKVMNQ